MRKGRMVIPLDPVRERASCPSDSIPYTSGGYWASAQYCALIWSRIIKLCDKVFRSVCLRAHQIAAIDHGAILPSLPRLIR